MWTIFKQTKTTHTVKEVFMNVHDSEVQRAVCRIPSKARVLQPRGFLNHIETDCQSLTSYKYDHLVRSILWDILFGNQITAFLTAMK